MVMSTDRRSVLESAYARGADSPTMEEGAKSETRTNDARCDEHVTDDTDHTIPLPESSSGGLQYPNPTDILNLQIRNVISVSCSF